MYKNLSINVKLPLTIGIVTLVVMAVMYTMLSVALERMSVENATRNAELSAIGSASSLTEEVNSAANTARAFAATSATIIESGLIPGQYKREALLSELKTLLASDKKMSNMWVMFEANAVDGLDAQFIGREDMGSNSSGIFAPWIIDGTLHAMELEDGLVFFNAAKTAMREVMTDPYSYTLQGQIKHMISLCIPILADGRFVGVAGTDFFAHELLPKIKTYDQNATGRLITDAGIIAISSAPDEIGDIFIDDRQHDVFNRLQEGNQFDETFEEDGETHYKVFVPVRLGENHKVWFYTKSTPLSEIYAQAVAIEKLLIIYCLFGLLTITLAGIVLIRKMLKNVTGITDIIRRLSLGKLDMQFNENRSGDEIGMMQRELNQLVSGLKNTADFAQSIGEGKLNAEHKLLSDDDVLGNSLLEMRDNLKNSADKQALHTKLEEQRSWVTTGLAKFAEILRQDNNDMEALTYNVVSNMVKYLGANQGSIFVLNEADDIDEKVLELKACYAFDRRKYAEKIIHPGDGLAGTCFLEGEQIYMTDVPDSYVNITSGLGKANPNSVLISPLKLNDQIFGVIELASFKEFENYQLEFVQKVGESIAATISTVHVNLRTSKLLERTKLQAEEMVNQEEELRQTMEEMQATQEETRRRESDLQETLEKMEKLKAEDEEKEFEMKQFHDGIFETCNVVEFSANGTLENINQNMLNLWNAEKNDFVGKHISKFIGEEVYNSIWPDMVRGRHHISVRNVESSGKIMQLKHNFMPVCNKNGELLRVMLLAYPE